MIDIIKLRNLNVLENIVVTKHAKDRMVDRGISIDDVRACIQNGEIIKQYEDDKPLPSCLIVGRNKMDGVMHIVVSHDEEFIYMITAYYPDPKEWDADYKKRKER